MNTISARHWSIRKKIFVAIGVIVVILAGIYIYFATQKFAGTKNVKEDYSANALSLIREFRSNDSVANAKYSDKTVIVSGVVAKLESPDTATVNILFIDPETSDYIIFAFQEQYLAEAKTVSVGDSISIKGNSSGSSYSEILDGYTIPFKRSTLLQNFSNPASNAANP